MRERLPIVLSITALLVALLGATPLGQAAYNVVVPENSVGAAQLRNGAVTTAKLRGNAVTSSKVKNRSLKAVDFAQGQLPAGATGEAGPAGVSGYEVIRVTKEYKTPFDPGGGVLGAIAQCPQGKVVTGGSSLVQQYNPVSFQPLGEVYSSQPGPGNRPDAWATEASFPRPGITGIIVHAIAFCVTASYN
jgi:hypothetical protein